MQPSNIVFKIFNQNVAVPRRSKFRHNAALELQNPAQMLAFFPLLHPANSPLPVTLPSLGYLHQKGERALCGNLHYGILPFSTFPLFNNIKRSAADNILSVSLRSHRSISGHKSQKGLVVKTAYQPWSRLDIDQSLNASLSTMP
jgi:hypothetical protein